MGEFVSDFNHAETIGERKEPGFVLPDLFLIVGLLVLVINAGSALALFFLEEPSTGEGPAVSEGFLWATIGVNFLVFILLPVLWLRLTITGGFRGMARYLGMKGGFNEVGIGAAIGFGMVIAVAAVTYLLDQAGLVPDAAPIEDLLTNITWPIALALSAVAAFGEEILFRGVLQRWLRWWGQGLVFGALHISNAGWFAFGVTVTIGLGFGLARHRGVSLWTLIAAHFVYDIILLGIFLMYPDAAGGAAL